MISEASEKDLGKNLSEGGRIISIGQKIKSELW